MPVAVNRDGRIGFKPDIEFFPYDSVKYTFAKAVSYGTRDAFEVFYFQAISLWRILKGDIPAKDSISSPIGMNLLPIPALDGGHMMFIIIESITGKKLSDKFMERAQVVGMVLLLSLMVFAVGNDILKMFEK